MNLERFKEKILELKNKSSDSVRSIHMKRLIKEYSQNLFFLHSPEGKKEFYVIINKKGTLILKLCTDGAIESGFKMIRVKRIDIDKEITPFDVIRDGYITYFLYDISSAYSYSVDFEPAKILYGLYGYNCPFF